MPKAIAIIVNANEGVDSSKIRLTTAVSVRPVTGDTFEPTSFESYIQVAGTENAQQLNSLILAQVKADALNKGITLADTDITTTKFA